MVVTAMVFSLSKGIIHPYYTVALAPAIGALVGIGANMMRQRRDLLLARCVLASTVVTTCAWGTGESWAPPATNPAMCAMSTMK